MLPLAALLVLLASSLVAMLLCIDAGAMTVASSPFLDNNNDGLFWLLITLVRIGEATKF